MLPVPCRILIDGAHLTISNLTLEDQGVYTCSAHTALDSAANETRVTVLGERRAVGTPPFR